jgi:hypothetical protein
MDGTVTAGGKGLPYLRDSYLPAVTERLAAALASPRPDGHAAQGRTAANAA